MKKYGFLPILSLVLLAAACSTPEDKSPTLSESFSNEWKYQAGEGDADWNSVDFDDSRWTDVTTDRTLADNNLSTEKGFGWYRKKITLTDEFYSSATKKGGVIFQLDSLAGIDTVFVNGVQAGAFSFANMTGDGFFSRRYFLPAKILKKGDNLVAVKFHSPWEVPGRFGKGLLKGAKLSLATAQTIDKLAIDYTVNDSDYIFLEPSPISVTVKLENANSWSVKGQFIVTITTDDFLPVKSDTAEINVKGGMTFSHDFVFQDPQPGFYRYNVQFIRDDIRLEKKFNAGFEPEKIQSPIDAHADFEAFWVNNLKELAKVAPQYRMTLIPDASNDDYEMYLVEMQSLGDNTIRGYYSKPKHEGRFPVIVEYMGYGSTPYCSKTEWDGFAHFVPSIRGQGLNRLTKEDDFWITIGLKDKEGYYYRGAFCDVVRALDFVCSRPEIDSGKIAVRGGSQGGALSFVAASLDKRVKVCAPNVPFLSDYRDYFKIVNWPRSDFDNYAARHPDYDWEHVYELLTYFDIKNLAQWIECPLLMAIGVQDETCPPHINFAAYNQVKSEKYWVASPRAGHNIPDPAIWENERIFIKKHLGLQ
jgi:cephalosporin-C deacetylase-like acetyl esterase